jgi:hypothetical protein
VTFCVDKNSLLVLDREKLLTRSYITRDHSVDEFISMFA